MKKYFVFISLIISLFEFNILAQEGILKTVYSQDGIVKLRVFDVQKIKIEESKSIETIKNIVGAQKDDELIFLQSTYGSGNMVHHLYQQYYKGIKVESGMYFAHVKNGFIESVNGDFYKVGKVNINTKLTEKEALKKH